MTAFEANFDGIVGPTHNYSGLALGNIASAASSGTVSNPREAAIQGLSKMRALLDMGLAQGVLPPHERPCVAELRRHGYSGSDHQVIEAVARRDPGLLRRTSSASAMWAANAATVSPSPDTADGRLHLTPANLVSHPHRAIESLLTTRIFEAIFPDRGHVVIHRPLGRELGDEGAANHTRLTTDHGRPGVELFVYGAGGATEPRRFTGRQSFAASEAVARRHEVTRAVLAQQHPDAIDAGVFHNDVISVGHLTTLLVHERAYLDQAAVLASLDDLMDGALHVVEVPERVIRLDVAVASYLFNSQLVTVDERVVLLAPAEIHAHPEVGEWLDGVDVFDEVHTFDLRQSMRNGGGPACLRLRVVLTEAEAAGVAPGTWLTPGLHDRLVDWIDRHYRDHLTPDDLADPALLDESRRALDDLTVLLGLGPIYDFQQ